MDSQHHGMHITFARVPVQVRDRIIILIRPRGPLH